MPWGHSRQMPVFPTWWRWFLAAILASCRLGAVMWRSRHSVFPILSHPGAGNVRVGVAAQKTLLFPRRSAFGSERSPGSPAGHFFSPAGDLSFFYFALGRVVVIGVIAGGGGLRATRLGMGAPAPWGRIRPTGAAESWVSAALAPRKPWCSAYRRSSRRLPGGALLRILGPGSQPAALQTAYLRRWMWVAVPGWPAGGGRLVVGGSVWGGTAVPVHRPFPGCVSFAPR